MEGKQGGIRKNRSIEDVKNLWLDEDIDPKDDIVFRALFEPESNADCLISMLNGLLELPDEERITEVRQLPPSGQVQEPRWKERFELRGQQSGLVFSEQLSIVLVELRKFKKPLLEVTDLGEKWILFLKEGLAMQGKVKDAAWMTPEIKKAIEELERLRGDEGFRAQYEARKRDLQIQMTLMEQRFNEGISEGRKEGRKEGIEEGERQASLRFARRLLSQGESLDRAAELTGFRVEELRLLRPEHN